MLDSIVSSQKCQPVDLGLINFEQAYRVQQEAVQNVISGGNHRLILCEHFPVFTLGRLASEGNFLFAKSEIERRGAGIFRINRGGEVTFHGPGQLVIYPIFRLESFGKDLKGFLNNLEEVAIDFLRRFDIVANRFPGQRGVWVENQKIASIGISVKKWVSFHGMALNVSTDMKYFAMVKPCGLNVRMTSMSILKGRAIDVNDVKSEMVKCFCDHFQLELASEAGQT